MLNSITLRNFRAFKHQRFEFAKINVFVGPNNSGKSSAISAINLLSQTISNSDIQQSPLVLNGQFDNLGTFLDLVHGNRYNTPLGLEVEFDNYQLKCDYKYRQSRREIETTKFEVFRADAPIFQYNTKKDSFDLKLEGQTFEALFPGAKKKRPTFSGMMPSTRFLAETFITQEARSESADRVNQLMRLERPISRARIALSNVFNNFDSLGPFRDRPQRTYLHSGETAQHIGATGSNMAVILSSDTSRRGSESLNMISEISRWFRVSGIADRVSVKSLTPRHFELALSDTKGSDHNICDVGFGCSQVLPVLVAALNIFGPMRQAGPRRRAMLVVQEPEIHLHPNAQASLGSFFAGLLRVSGQMFIETHSDNLVIRLARHVADGTLDPDDVKVFYVHKVNGQSVVENISVTGGGKFDPQWPGGFFPQRQSESLSLAQVAYQVSKSGPPQKQLEFKYPEEN